MEKEWSLFTRSFHTSHCNTPDTVVSESLCKLLMNFDVLLSLYNHIKIICSMTENGWNDTYLQATNYTIKLEFFGHYVSTFIYTANLPQKNICSSWFFCSTWIVSWVNTFLPLKNESINFPGLSSFKLYLLHSNVTFVPGANCRVKVWYWRNAIGRDAKFNKSSLL